MAYVPPTRRRKYEPIRVPFDNRRNKNNKFYKSKDWRDLRAFKLTIDPFCECGECNNSPLPKRANMVDHKKRINPINAYDTEGGKWGEPLDIENLQSMYSKHHNSKSGKESHGYEFKESGDDKDEQGYQFTY